MHNGSMEDVSATLTAFETALSNVEKHMQPLLDRSPGEINAQLNVFERAKLEMAMAYSMNSLFWSSYHIYFVFCDLSCVQNVYSVAYSVWVYVYVCVCLSILSSFLF